MAFAETHRAKSRQASRNDWCRLGRRTVVC